MLQKKYIILLLTGLFLSGNAHAQWITQRVPTKNNLNSIHILNEYTGWIVGDKGTMLYKYKEVWKKYKAITEEDLYSVCLIDSNDGWAVGSNGTILKFNGTEWESFPSPTRQRLNSVSFSDSDHGIAVGEKGTVIVYQLGNWTLLKNRIKGNFYTVSAKSDISMIGGGLEAVSVPVMMLNSGKQEKTLVRSMDPGLIEIRGLAITDPNNIWAVGRPGKIFHFEGSNWTELPQTVKLPSLNNVYFSDNKTGIAVGYGGAIMTFTGKQWTMEESPVKVKLNGSTVAGGFYYAVGDEGTLISQKKITLPVTTWSNSNDNEVTIVTYPNPTSEITNLIIPEEDNFTGILTVTNASGQVILMKELKQLSSGQNFQINTSQMASGLYYVNIKSQGKRATGKFIVKH